MDGEPIGLPPLWLDAGAKDARSIVLRTVFGKVDVLSPRLWACSCAAKRGQPRRSVSPLCKAVHQRVTPESAYLQAKWAAHLPYRQATELLREVLSLEKVLLRQERGFR